MKFSLHAHSLSLHMGLRNYKPIGQGIMQLNELFEKAKSMGVSNLQLVQKNLPENLDMMALARIGNEAKRFGITLFLSTDTLEGTHLANMIHAASTCGAKSVTVGISHLKGNVKERQARLQNLINDLEPALKAAEKWKIHLLIENGRHSAAVDLLAFIQALSCSYVGVCFDTGNPLSVPENPLESVKTLLPYIRAMHIKDFEVFRSREGIKLVNSPLGTGSVPLVEILKVTKEINEKVPMFIQTDAVRLDVPLLKDSFLDDYPRITAKAVVAALRNGKITAEEDKIKFPFETKNSDKVILDFEEDRLQKSLKEMHKLIGLESLTLSL